MKEYDKKESKEEITQGIGTVIGTVIGRILICFLVTLLLVVIALYTVMHVLCFGPSASARNLFVLSVRETSAIGFLADLYLTEDEIAEIEASQQQEIYEETDTSLITINEVKTEKSSETTAADAWGFVDEDGDGIIVDEVRGEGYSGYMMIVLDPTRVIMGCVPDSLGSKGYTVAEMVEYYDAVAGINAGGFQDVNGQGDGSSPDSMIVFEGKKYYQGWGTRRGFVGLDADGILHVGNLTAEDVDARNIQYGVSFGPVLVNNGEPVDQSGLNSGVNPRTAIGQRSDGAILLLVIDGRQVISLGATYTDLVNVMLRYGAVNACNLDGGSSSLMWYQGDYINNCASVIGIRDIPTTFLVLKQSEDND